MAPKLIYAEKDKVWENLHNSFYGFQKSQGSKEHMDPTRYFLKTEKPTDSVLR